ncbi:hypothetical protein FEM48_Zijuj01G0013600 [Ziziphus jujuba var. spinosa]|uniref:Metaxin n=1 Tax=Ziziphus jujuba var. spinosa TaxID=714518 RepID=A0A978VYB7_ZIZJJ|nr:hypothetical protein FEM48_Zijuj01G0013600 [Ziziphus jujuba var. spinosa]
MEEVVGEREEYTLVVRKPCFGLPTACPSCLPAYFYLKFSNLPFNLDFNLIYPDSDRIPYVESGDYVAYNNEKGGVIERLKGDGIVDLDIELYSVPEWISLTAMISTWLADALVSSVDEQIYRKANIAYGALSTRLGEQKFFFENRPSSLDAIFLGQTLITLQALPETSLLRSKLLEHDNLVKYAERLKTEFVDASSSSSVPHFHAESSSSAPRRGPPKWSKMLKISDTTCNFLGFIMDMKQDSILGSKPKTKPKREKTKEEKTFRRRAKYFVVTQLVSVLLFLTLMGRPDDVEVELDDDDESYE